MTFIADGGLICISGDGLPAIVLFCFFFNLLSLLYRLLQKYHFPEMKFSLYFLGFEEASAIPEDADERTKWLCAQKATLELTQ